MHFRQRMAATLLAGIILIMPGVGAAEQSPALLLATLNKEIQAGVSGTELTDTNRQDNFRAILRRAFNLEYACQFVLGRHGRGATAEQKAEFRTVFEDLLVATWTPRFREYGAQDIQFGEPILSAEGEITVASVVGRTGQPPLSVEWRLRDDAGTYRLVDIKAEGVSMLVTYRSEYQGILKQSGVDGLNGLLRTKVKGMAASG